MLPHRISAKFPIANPAALDLPAVIPVFHRWIQQSAAPGLLIDVADYRHVPDGPGVLLVGHQGDYAVDLRDGRPGVQYTGKRGWPDDPAGDPGQRLRTRLAAVLNLARQAGQTLRAEPFPRGRLAVREDEVELRFLDHLRTPNDVETFAAVRPQVEAALAELYPGKAIVLRHASADPRLPLTIHATLAA